MKLTKEYIVHRLLTTSVADLAVELANQTAKQYPTQDTEATIEKFKDMLRPLAPVKEVTAKEMFEGMGIHVVTIA